MERPLGIVLIVILEVVSNAIGVFGSLVVMALPVPRLQLLGLVLLGLCFLGLASAYGLWTFQSWGRVLAIVLNLAAIPLSFVAHAAIGTTVGVLDFVLMGVSVTVIVYLLEPSVADRFGAGTPSAGPGRADVRPSYASSSSYDVRKWNALTELDPEIAAAVAQVQPYGSPALAELAAKYLTLNDKQYLAAIVKQVTDKYSARLAAQQSVAEALEKAAEQGAAEQERRMGDELGRKVDLVWRTPWGTIVKLRDDRALVIRPDGVEVLPSLEEVLRRYGGQSEGWVEIADIEEKRRFYQEARIVLQDYAR